MPVAGPRDQRGALPGYRNPGGQTPNRFHLTPRTPVAMQGETPGLMYITRHTRTLAPGFVRRWWRQTMNVTNAQAPFSWTANKNIDGGVQGFDLKRPPLRYMTSHTVYVGTGIDNTRFSGLHTSIEHRSRQKPIAIGLGQTRSRPTVRNRMASFGSKVPTLNQPVQGAQTNGGS
jgi:hypothetical protein